jgi:hypothetical protein
MSEWTTADAWVFAAIEPGGCTLPELLDRADGINHASLLESELTTGLARLVTAGLVGVSPEADRCWHTPSGTALYERAMRGRGLFGWIDALPPALARLGPPVDAAWSLPPGTFRRAEAETASHRRRR